MIINGREIGFLRTVEATCEIADLCEGRTLENFTKLFEGAQSDIIRKKALIIHYLNKGYENNRVFSESGYKATPISVEEILALKSEDYMNLYDEAIDEFINSSNAKPTVETEPAKKEKGEEEGK